MFTDIVESTRKLHNSKYVFSEMDKCFQLFFNHITKVNATESGVNGKMLPVIA